MKKNLVKKSLSIFVCIALILTLIPIGNSVSAAASTAVSVQLTNPGFEEELREGSIPGWSLDPVTTGGAIEVSEAYAKTGSKSIRLYDPTIGPVNTEIYGVRILSDKIPVVPGEKYTLTADVYVVQQTHGIIYEVQYFDANDSEIKNRQTKNNSKGSLQFNAWNNVSLETVAPSNAVYARIGFYSGGISQTDAYFDDVTMTYEKAEETGPVQNLDFEMDLVDGKIPGWSLVKDTDGTWELSTAQVQKGTKSLYFKDNDPAKKLGVASDAIPVNGGKEYIAKAYAYVISQTNSLTFEVQWFDDASQKINGTFINFNLKNGLKVNEWSLMEVPFTPPAEAASVKIVFTCGGNVGQNLIEAYLDNVTVAEKSSGAVTEIFPDIQNPGFEADLVDGKIPGWSLMQGPEGSTSISTERAHSGSKSLYFHDNSTSEVLRMRSNAIAVVPGTSYIARAMVNVVSQSHNVVLEVYYYNSLDQSIGAKQELYGANGLGTNRWSSINMYSTAPENAAYARVVLYSGDVSVTECYFDDVSFTSVPAETPLNRQYQEAVNLGAMVLVSLGQAGAIQTNSLGENEAYFVTNGKPGSFWVVDAETGELKFSEVIPNTVSTWAITIGPDKNVYFSGTEDSKLYRYLPAERKVELLGTNPSSAMTWDIEAARDGKIYGGTYAAGGQGKVYEYNPATGEFRDYGVVKEKQDYVRGIGVDDKYIYAGVGNQSMGLVRIDRVSGEKEEIEMPGYTGTAAMLQDIFVVNNKLLLSVRTNYIVVMDKDTLEIEGAFDYNAMISEPNPSNPDEIYFKFGTKLCKYSFSKRETTVIPLSEPLPDTARVKDMEWIRMNSGEKAGKTVLASITQYGEYFLYDPADHWFSSIILDIDPQPVNVQSLKTGEKDGKLYLGGYQRGMSVYNPFTNKTEVNISSFAQPENIGFLNDYVYYGTYVGAVIYRLDPNKAIMLGENPKLVFDIEHQDRPFAFATGDDMLFVGTVADYGILGGALAVYDEKSDRWKQYDDIVEDQAIISLAYKDGLVYGGTTIWGGLGIEPTQSEAKIFVWDAKTNQKIDEFTPNIPGIDETPKMIGTLKFGPDGKLWGVVDGTIFAMDVETKEVVKSKLIRPSRYNSSKWKSYELEFAPDGTIYTTLARKVIAVDPETLDYKIIYDGMVNEMAVGIDGSIYFVPGAGIDMHKIAVPETDATLSDISINEATIAGFSPGVREYNLKVPSAEVQAVATQAGAAVEVIPGEQQTVIHVKASDGKSALIYKINWNWTETEEPEKPVEPSNPSGSGSGNIEQTAGNVNIKAETLKTDKDIITIALEKDVSSVTLPGNSAELVGKKTVVLIKDEISLEVNSEILRQIQKVAENEEIKDAFIKISFASVQKANEQKLLEDAAKRSSANIKAGSEIYDISFSAVGREDRTATISKLEKPIKLSVKIGEGMDADLTAIYLIAEDSMLTYAGGITKDGEVSAEVKGKGRYAVLEYNKSFSDVADHHWAADVIKKMAARQIASGVSASQFAPGLATTRAEFVSFIAKALGLEAEGESSFADVKAGAWYSSAVAAVYEAGIISGISPTEFAPDSIITREQMAVVILKAYEYKTRSKADGISENHFDDYASFSSWAAPSINSAVKLGLLSGRGNNRFVPQGELTRAEALQAVYNMLMK